MPIPRKAKLAVEHNSNHGNVTVLNNATYDLAHSDKTSKDPCFFDMRIYIHHVPSQMHLKIHAVLLHVLLGKY